MLQSEGQGGGGEGGWVDRSIHLQDVGFLSLTQSAISITMSYKGRTLIPQKKTTI